MRILISSDVTWPYIGGGEIIQFNIAKRITNLGNKITWVGAKIPGKKDKLDNIKFYHVWIPFHEKFIFTRKFYPFTSFFPLLKLSRKHDILQFNSFIGALNGSFIGKISKKPYLCFVTSIFGDLWKKFDINKLQKLLYPQIERFIAKSYPFFITLSNYSKGILVKLGVAKETIKVIYPGVDHNLFNQKCKGIYRKKGSKIIGWAGRFQLSYQKNLKDLLLSFGIIKKEIKNAILLLAGSNFKIFIPQIKEFKLKIGKDVIYVGQLKNEEMPYFYTSCDVYLLPSYAETFGMTVLESQACGTPVVCYNSTALPEVVKNKKTGIVIKKDDGPVALAEAAIDLLTNSEKRKKMKKNCKKWVYNFSWERAAKEFLHVYNEVIAMKNENIS
jgi:glycosyltransferase involved in cell wall biosynthesis